MDSPTGTSIVTAFDYVWGRTTDRLAGLTDEEYFWEPVADCWSLRQQPDGTWALDGGGGGRPAPDPAPFTTIAWRVCHLAGQAIPHHRERLFAPEPGGRPPFPATVAGIPDFLDANYAPWRRDLLTLGEDEWHAKLGERWGFYAESTRFDLALHVFDELVHHAGEVGVVRDLYAHRATLTQLPGTTKPLS